MLPNSRTQVKQEAKEYLRASYWPAVATALVLALVTGGITAGSGGAEINYTINGSSSFYRLQRLMPAAVSLSGVVLALKIFVMMPLEAAAAAGSCTGWTTAKAVTCRTFSLPKNTNGPCGPCCGCS